MRVIVQRVSSGSVRVDGKTISEIGKGIVCLTGLCETDTQAELEWISEKLLNMKLWPDEEDRPWRNSVRSLNYEVLIVSQFTVYALLNKGTKPDFHLAMKPERAGDMFQKFVDLMKSKHVDRVGSGVFAAMMEVELVNDGPVTFTLDSPTHLQKS